MDTSTLRQAKLSNFVHYVSGQVLREWQLGAKAPLRERRPWPKLIDVKVFAPVFCDLPVPVG